MLIHSEFQGKVLVWEINRPERRNALGTILSQELWEKVQQLQIEMSAWRSGPTGSSPKMRALVIKAKPVEGKTAVWMAGGDLKELQKLTRSDEGREYAETMAQAILGLQNLPSPVLVCIDGLVLGGGLEFILGADIRLATKRSEFFFKQLEIGLATAYGSAHRLIQLIGLSRATDCLFNRRRLSAEKALEWGLIHELDSDAGAMEKKLQQLLKGLLELSPESLAVQKQILHLGSHDAPRMQKEIDLFASLWMKPYHKAYLDAFVQKSKGPG